MERRVIGSSSQPQNEYICGDAAIAIDRLVRGHGVRVFHIYDVSDCQLYGCKHKRALPFSLARLVVTDGYAPVLYQSVYWFCLVYVPILPFGTYLILTQRDELQAKSDAEVYRGVRIPTDWNQVASHWAISCAVIGVAAIATMWIL